MHSKLKILKLHVNYLVTLKINLQTTQTSKEKDDKDLAILVGGAGFTGIEFLGELTERILNYVINTVLIKTKLE